MPNGTKKGWFKKVFGGSSTPDPDKVAYEQKLAQVSPSIKQAAKLPAYKEAMALGLKEVDRFVKSKEYSQATARLEALGKQAQLALGPSLGTAPNRNQLDKIAKDLSNTVGKARSEKVTLLRPTLEEEEAAVLAEIENQNDVAADNYLVALQLRIDTYKTDRTASQAALDKALREAQQNGVTFSGPLAGSIEGIRGMVNSGQFKQANVLIGRLQQTVDQSVALRRDLQDLYDRATGLNLGTKPELDAQRDPVTQELGRGDLVQAAAALQAFQQFFDERERREREVFEGLSDVGKSITDNKLTLVPPANLDKDNKAIRELLRQGKIAEAEGALTTLRAALKPAAELHRLRQLLDRLVTEEAMEKRVDPVLLDKLKKEAMQFLDALNAKQAQSAIKKISDAIAAHNSLLPVDKQLEVASARIAKKIASRLKKSQELAKTSTDDTVQTLIEEMEALEPPFDQNSEAKAAEIYAQIVLKTGNGKFERLSGSANGVFVLKTPDKVDIDGTKYKQFFKPVSGESGQPGFPKGTGACREVVGKAIGDKMSAMMGINLHVAETHLVELPPDVLPPDLAKKGPALGSMQHNVHNKGDAPQHKLSELTNDERDELYAKIPKKKAQAQQVYDLVFANLDRHADNIFVKGEGDEAELSGIDNGMGMPSRQGLLMRSEAFGGHALQNMPANKGKLDPEVLDAIDKLDPDELGKTAKDSFAEMKKQFPSSEATSDDKLNDEHLEVMKASIRFLKKAAKELTVNELYNAYLVNLQDIYGFDNPDNQGLSEEERFEKAIAEAKSRGAALEEFNANEKEIRSAFVNNGWGFKPPPWGNRGWIANANLTKFYPKQAVAIWKANGALKGPMPVKNVPNPPPGKPLANYDQKEIEACAKALGSEATKISEEDMRYWDAYQALGGDAALQRLGGAPSADMALCQVQSRYALVHNLMAIKAAIEKVPV